MNLETLGLLGIFIAGAIPWMEAIAVVPVGILFGLDPVLVVVSAVVGNATTIFAFAYLSSQIREALRKRREEAGKVGESKRFVKAQDFFDRYGIFGLAALGPVLIGTQFAAAIAVAAGIRPLRASILITLSTALWAIGIAVALVFFGVGQSA